MSVFTGQPHLRSLSIEPEDLELSPFNQRGGLGKAHQLFGDELPALLDELSRYNRKESERFKSFAYDELTKRDKVNLDIFWLKADALEKSANLPAPEIIAADITADLEAAVEQFATIAEDLKQ